MLASWRERLERHLPPPEPPQLRIGSLRRFSGALPESRSDFLKTVWQVPWNHLFAQAPIAMQTDGPELPLIQSQLLAGLIVFHSVAAEPESFFAAIPRNFSLVFVRHPPQGSQSLTQTPV